MSMRAMNRRAKLVEEAQAAGDRVIEAAQAWKRDYLAGQRDTASVEAGLVAAVLDLDARVARAEKALKVRGGRAGVAL